MLPERPNSPPPLVGLCPGEHTSHFYMPLDPGDSTTCPECEEKMVVYAPVDELLSGPLSAAARRYLRSVA